jgi:hypothetical protein
MKYEKEFRIKEKEFRPRPDFKHANVVNELANIVKRADLEIEEVYEDMSFMIRQRETRENILLVLLGVSLAINIGFLLF